MTSIRIGVLMAEPNRNVSRKIKEKVEANQCLICDCDNAPKIRGLCWKHYQQFRRNAVMSGDTAKQQQFEMECISSGLILANQAVRDIRSSSPFAARRELVGNGTKERPRKADDSRK